MNSLRITLYLLLAGSGFFAGLTYDRWPQKPLAYTVTVTSDCLTKGDCWFTMDYEGWGMVKFNIVTPKEEPSAPQNGGNE